jgi:hypothetical protein
MFDQRKLNGLAALVQSRMRKDSRFLTDTLNVDVVDAKVIKGVAYRFTTAGVSVTVSERRVVVASSIYVLADWIVENLANKLDHICHQCSQSEKIDGDYLCDECRHGSATVA